MAYFADLTEYTYRADEAQPSALNVGWLEQPSAFPVGPPSEETLEVLWACCGVATNPMRGLHDCAFCGPEHRCHIAARSGERIWLGSAEIRVFSADGQVYAAPNLIYHSVRRHHYSPPDAFLRALHTGPRPPNPEYFERLQARGLEWRNISAPPSEPRIRKREVVDGVEQFVWKPFPACVDED